MDSALHDVPSASVCLASTRNVPESQVPLHVAFRTCHSPEHRVSDTDSNSTGTRADEQDFYGIVQGKHARRGWIRTFVKTTVFLAVFTFISLAIAAVLLIMLLSSLSETL